MVGASRTTHKVRGMLNTTMGNCVHIPRLVMVCTVMISQRTMLDMESLPEWWLQQPAANALVERGRAVTCVRGPEQAGLNFTAAGRVPSVCLPWWMSHD